MKSRSGQAITAFALWGIFFLRPACPSPADPVLATLESDGGSKAVERTVGDLDIRLTAAPDDFANGAGVALVRIRSPAGTIDIAIKGDETPASTACVVRLAPGSEPQVLFQRAATGSAACVVSKLAFLFGGAWRVIDLDQTCESEEGYRIVDADGDGFGELISTVDYFDVFESHPHEVGAPIRIQRFAGDRMVVATGAKRYHDYLRKSSQGSPAAPSEPSDDAEPSYLPPAGWMATEALLGETPGAWAKMVRRYAHDTRAFDVCAVRVVRDACPKGQTVKRPFLQALSLVLVADNYVASATDLPLP